MARPAEASCPGADSQFITCSTQKVCVFEGDEGLFSNPTEALEADSRTLADLIYGWGNEAWSAQEEYLKACIRHASRTEGPILECGSGLSTILIGAVAKPRGVTVWTLEHSAEWAERVGEHLKRHDLNSVKLLVSTLTNYGGFDWYQAPVKRMPRGFELVICDGPPGTTAGGRYGMLPVMHESLARTCVVLLDDGERSEEVEAAQRWCEEFGMEYESFGSHKPYLRVTYAASDNDGAAGDG